MNVFMKMWNYSSVCRAQLARTMDIAIKNEHKGTSIPPRFFRGVVHVLILPRFLIPHHARFGLCLHLGIVEYAPALLVFRSTFLGLLGIGAPLGLLRTVLVA